MSVDFESRIPAGIIHICKTLQRAGYQAYLVGGAIRDLIRLPLEPEAATDFDIATSALPEEITRIFGKSRTIPTGIKHGTVTVLLPVSQGTLRTKREHVEVTTFRKESHYVDGRRPEQIAFLQDLSEDLKRRDFTMNAIAYDPSTNKVTDPFSGEKDIRNRFIRAVGDPEERFSEDGLRPLRAIRFAAQLGFEIENQTFAAISKSISTFRKVSQERIRDELLKLLEGIYVLDGLNLLSKSGLLFEIFPELSSLFPSEVEKQVFTQINYLPRSAFLRLGTLLRPLKQANQSLDILKSILIRLKLSNQEQTRILSFSFAEKLDFNKVWIGSQIRRFLSKTNPQLRSDLFSLHRSFLLSQSTEESQRLLERSIELENKIKEELERHPPLSIQELAVSGEDIMKILNIPPGKMIGKALSSLFDQVLENPSLNTKENLKQILINTEKKQ